MWLLSAHLRALADRAQRRKQQRRLVVSHPFHNHSQLLLENAESELLFLYSRRNSEFSELQTENELACLRRGVPTAVTMITLKTMYKEKLKAVSRCVFLRYAKAGLVVSKVLLYFRRLQQRTRRTLQQNRTFQDIVEYRKQLLKLKGTRKLLR